MTDLIVCTKKRIHHIHTPDFPKINCLFALTSNVMSDSESEDEDVEETQVTFRESKIVPEKGILQSKKDLQREIGDPIVMKKEDIDVNKVHDQWGHNGIHRLKAMARIYGFSFDWRCGIGRASPL